MPSPNPNIGPYSDKSLSGNMRPYLFYSAAVGTSAFLLSKTGYFNDYINLAVSTAIGVSAIAGYDMVRGGTYGSAVGRFASGGIMLVFAPQIPIGIFALSSLAQFTGMFSSLNQSYAVTASAVTGCLGYGLYNYKNFV